MITAKLCLKKGEIRKSDNRANIKIRVTRDRIPRYISTEFDVHPDYWNPESDRIIEGERDKKGKLLRTKQQVDDDNRELLLQLAEILTKIKNDKDVLERLDMNGVMAHLRDRRSSIGLVDILDDKIEQKKKEGVDPVTVIATRSKVVKFAGKKVAFEQVSQSWLEKFQRWMLYEEVVPKGKRTSSLNTVKIKMEEIRHAWNIAKARGIANPADFPFGEDKYVIPSERVIKRNLTTEDIAKIYVAEIDHSTIRFARDMFMLSFFLIGINMKDLCRLKKITDGRIRYVRSKGKKPYNIKVEPEALEYINRYGGKNWLVNIYDHYKNHKTAMHLIDDRLKEVALICGIDRELSTYYARHSWARIARKVVKASKEDVSLGLGHTLKKKEIRITEDYLEDEDDLIIVDETNRAVIDAVLKTAESLTKIPKEKETVFKDKDGNIIFHRRSNCKAALSVRNKDELN
jgi:integrase